MSDITTRAGKGSPLTNAEVDANFENLNNDKLESVSQSDVTQHQAALTITESQISDLDKYTQAEVDALLASLEAYDQSLNTTDDVAFASVQLTGGTLDQGTITWNTDEETLDVVLNGATLQVGQEVHYHVRNNTGSTIADGVAVYATGTLGASGRITVAPYIANGTIPAKYFLGVTTESIADGTDGKVTHFGKVRQLDTSAFTDGDVLYPSSTTAGALTATAPTGSNIALPSAIVIHAASNGTLFVRATTLDENAYATAAQGALADSALQSGDNVSELTNDAGYATTGYVDTSISNLVDTAPATLDTLNELAAALGDDPNFATTVSTQIGTKLDATANAVSATKLQTARIIGLSGDVSGSVSFDGTANVTITATVADDSHNHVIANVDGLQTALDGKVDDSQVLTNVPAGAVFTDTTYSVGNGGLTEINFTSALNTKLAGIEAGATGDQTASEILTALKTVDGAGSGLDADLLDGQSSAYYATAAHNHTLDGLSNTTITSNTSGEILKWNGTAWVNNTLAEAGIQPAGSYITTATTFGGDVSGTYNAIVVADDSHNHIIANVDGLQAALDGKSATTHNHTLDGLSNTTITSNTSGEILKWNGSAWINNTLAEAGIQPAGSYLTGNQTITLTGDVSGSGTTSISVTVADDSHNHIIANVDGLQAALDGKQAAGTYNTIIGTDTDINTSGATIIDNIYVTDGVITSMGTRTFTAADIGALTGDTKTLAKAWVNFEGIGAIGIRRSYNTSSITDYGTGNWAINYATAMPNANVAFAGSAKQYSLENHGSTVRTDHIPSSTTTTRFTTNGNSTTNTDSDFISVIVFC